MAKYINRKQLCNASDEDIIEFFSKTIFHGVFSSEIKSTKHASYYKGNISNITLDGNLTPLCPTFLNVPASSNDISEGPCTFKCRINLEALRSVESKYIVNVIGNSIRKSHKEIPIVNPDNTTEQDLFEMWGVDDCRFIGFYHYDEVTGTNVVDDIRKPNFDHIPFYPNDPEEKPICIRFPFELYNLKKNEYYLFSWKLSKRNKFNPYEIYLDIEKQKPQIIDPEWFINTLFDDRHNDKSKNFDSTTNFLDTLSKQLSAKESTFVYELLQNANDYPVENKKVDVEFHITDNYLLFMHTGEEFNIRNISGICGINEKEKVANKRTIGYKGIGFKTVFLNNHYVYIRTGKYSFRFDEKASKIKRLKAPWPILPVWTRHNEVDKEVNAIFDNVSKNFRVQIALRPDNKRLLHTGKTCYENLFNDVFSDSNIILFIPNINSVKVVIRGEVTRLCQRNNDEWIVCDYEQDIDNDLQALINKTIDTGKSRIPEKYKDFDVTKVSFACKHDGSVIKPISDSILYCYLPTKTSWGFPFLLNSDMIPKGDRNDIETEVLLLDEETNFNEELTSIAGTQFYHWIYDLLTSRKYELSSVFSLVPDFDKCIREHNEYKDYIEKFQKSFETVLGEKQLIPVCGGIANINYVVYDTTGITSAGIMSDEDFLSFIGLTDVYLPLPIIRTKKAFNKFLKRYARKDLVIDLKNLHEMIKDEGFQIWLKVQDNNNKFLRFLLENGYLEEFLGERIFIEEECGDLFSAEELFYDIDEELKDLSAFSNYIFYLSLKTRDFFIGNERWEEIVNGKFAEFDGDKFIKNTLLSENWDETIKALSDWETSFHFYRYITNNNIVPEELNNLPFFNDEETAEVVDNFNDKFVFLSSDEGKKLFKASWLSSVPFAFISAKYGKDILDYFKKNITEVRDFSHAIIAQDIILSEDYKDEINNLQQVDIETSIDFVGYCYEHKDLFDNGSLHSYALSAFDCEGENAFVLSENHIFFSSSYFDLYSEKEWMNSDWMYCLDSKYLDISTDQADIKKFLNDVFYVEELDEKIFYKEVIVNNIPSIIYNTSGTNDMDGKKNLDFISYLDDNYKLIFEEEKDAEKFASFIFISDNEDGSYSNIESESTYIYAYDEELKKILDSSWFPADTVSLCSRNYDNSKAIIAINAKKYNFSEFFDEVITEELSNINDTIVSKEASIAFHSFIIEHLRSLTDPQKEVMKYAKVYLYGSNKPCDSSAGHKILSKSARELSSMGLVEFADLDIIDPDYHVEDNEDYWKNRLGNEQFTVLDFINWLDENKDTFYNTIENKDNNINFWRWVKKCELSDQTIEKLPVLPIFLNDDNYSDSDSIIYLSDAYIEEGGLETLVKKYNSEAFFISAEYMQEEDNVNSWKDFWVKIGVRFEMIDILIDTIDNRLSEIEDVKLPATIAKYRAKLDEHYDGKLISKLTDLRVKAHDKIFHNLNEILYISCEKEEPFKFIELPNQVTFATTEERKLIIDIIEEVEGEKIDRLTEWQAAKINRYIEIQNDSDLDALLRSIHFNFVDELAGMYSNDRDFLKQFENISEVLFLDSNETFCKAEELTLGSIYNPFCDFEKFGLDYQYLSESYKSECSNDIRKMLNRIFKVHCDFKKDDVEKLVNRDFSIYFWSQYLIKKDADISGVKELIDDGVFNSFECIPTKDFMKSPKELYYGSDVSKYVKYIEDWENKVPLKNLPDIKLDDGYTIFSKLPFKNSLNFLDGLYALISVQGQDRRTQILEWMIDSYDEAFYGKVLEYREDEHALWYNNKNDKVQIKKLYALNYWEKTLEQYFGNNPRIVNKAYFPVGDSFKKACDILGIKTISLSDLKMEPQEDTIFTQRNRDLKLFALVIAGMIDTNNWKELYEGFLEKLNSLVLHRCKSIMITYKEDESINQSLMKFYRENDSDDFYFVDSLDGKRVFTLFVKEFAKYLGIKEDDIRQEMIEDIMDSTQNAMALIREQNSLLLDDEFKDALEDIIPGIKRELNGKEALDDNDNEPIIYRPTFTTSVKQESEDYDEANDIGYESDEVKMDNESMSDDFNEPNSSSANISEGEISECAPRSDKGGTHFYPETYYRTDRTSMAQNQSTIYSSGEKVENSHHSYTNNNGWNDSSRSFTPLPPKPFSPEDVRNFGSHGVTRTLDILEPMRTEVDEINRILGEDLSAEQVADQNYLAQLRLYNNLVKRNMMPDETKEDFVRNGHMKNEHTIKGGKYIHKCSAAGGIMYISPSIWNKIADDKCVVCVYLGAKSNEFMYFNSIEDILKWIGEDDIIIKLTGEEKADVVEKLYSGILYGIKGTAYTLIRINSNEKYNSLFAQLPSNDISEQEENEDEY